jgi:hypothetical protein
MFTEFHLKTKASRVGTTRRKRRGSRSRRLEIMR